MATTTTQILADIKRHISMPESQVLLSDDDILKIVDDDVIGTLVPFLLAARQDYFVTSSEVPLVANQASYAIPYRAVGRALRDLKIRDSSGTVRSVSLIPIEDEHRLTTSGAPYSFYFKGDKIVLVPTPTNALSTLVFWWDLPPGSLVTVSSAATITGISGATITISSAPSTFTAGVLVDFIQGKSGNAHLAIDKAISGVAGLQLTFAAADVPSDLAVGDYIALAGESPVVQLPNEAIPLLKAHSCQGCLEAIGDFEGAGRWDKQIADLEKSLRLVLQPRIQGEPSIVLNRNGLLRQRGFSPRRGYLLY